MGAPYSQDLRERVLAAYARGIKTKPIVAMFNISPAWARRVKQRWQQSGERAARPMGGLRVVKIDLQRLGQWVKEQPDATTCELHQRLVRECGVQCSESAVGMALLRLGLSFKKRASMPPSRIGRMSRTNAGAGRAGSQRSRVHG